MSTNSLPCSPPKRKSDLTIAFDHGEPGAPILVTMTSRGQTSDYWCERIPADFGVGVRFRTMWNGRDNDFGSEVYDVLLDTVSWLHSCECLGHLRHGTHCKHIRAAIQLFDAGRLVLPPRPEHADERPAKQHPTPCVVTFDDP